jgi:mono/diheme cytochrome c family protein
MRRHHAAVLGLVATLVAVGCARRAPEPTPVERGKYLVNVGGCNHCHTPKLQGESGPRLDTAHLLSGHPQDMTLPPPPQLAPGPWIAATDWTMTAWSGPWGISYGANLTPDDETGIGAWDEAMFVNALRKGQHLGAGRPILPPMPWEDLGHVSDDDLKAIFAYLKSLPPVKNKVPEPMAPPAPPQSAAM